MSRTRLAPFGTNAFDPAAPRTPWDDPDLHASRVSLNDTPFEHPRTFSGGSARLRGSLDIYNIFNASSVLSTVVESRRAARLLSMGA